MNTTTKEKQSDQLREQKKQGSISENSYALKSFSGADSGKQSFTDNRPASIIQRRRQEMMDNSPQVQKGMQRQEMINNSARVKEGARIQSMIDNSSSQVAQRKKLESIFGAASSPLQKKAEESQAIETTTEKAVTVEQTSETLSTETEVDPGTVKTEDVKYELIAHGLAYRTTIAGEGIELLKSWGYKQNWQGTINDTNSGFFAGLLLPAKDSLVSPIIVFRGTETTNMKDAMADADPYAVGYTSFMLNRAKLVSDFFGNVDGKKVDVVGHSLGGALAKFAAVEFPDLIRRVVTFQAPGINPQQAEQFNNLKSRPSVTCHIADGDIVDTAGDGHIEDEIYKHYRTENKYLKPAKYIPGDDKAASVYSTAEGLLTHTESLLTSKKYEKQQKELLPPGWNLQHVINAVNDPEDKDKKLPFQSEKNPDYYTQYPHPYKNTAAEIGRRELGRYMDPQASVINDASNEQVTSMPSYARINILKNLTTDTSSDEGTHRAISKIIYCSHDYLVVIPEVGLINIFNSWMDERHSNLLLQYLKGINFYKKLYSSQQIFTLENALYSEMHKRQEVVVDLLTTIAAPEARVLISEIGRKSNYKNISITNYNAGLHSITASLTGNHDTTIRNTFPFD